MNVGEFEARARSMRLRNANPRHRKEREEYLLKEAKRLLKQGKIKIPQRIPEPWEQRRAEYLREVGRKEPE